jgi:hypothetical protein
MASKSKNVRLEQLRVFEKKLALRLQQLEQKGISKENVQKDPLVKSLKSKIRETNLRIAALGKLVLKTQELAQAKAQKLVESAKKEEKSEPAPEAEQAEPKPKKKAETAEKEAKKQPAAKEDKPVKEPKKQAASTAEEAPKKAKKQPAAEGEAAPRKKAAKKKEE